MLIAFWRDYVTSCTMQSQQTTVRSLATVHPVANFGNKAHAALPAQIYGSIPVLLVDDDSAIRRALRRSLEAWGCHVGEAENGRDALEQLAMNPRQLVLSDIDMPEMDGLDLLVHMEKEFPDSGIIMVTGMSHEKLIDEALERGAIGFIQKPFRIPELKSQVTFALRKLLLTNTNNTVKIVPPVAETGHNPESSAREFARLFVLTSDLHHVETGTHIRRIGRLSKLLADLAGCTAEFSNLIGDAAVLHDIGKLAIPDAILKKPGPLTPEEFDIMKTHPVLGGQILAGAKDPFLQMAHTVALYHHERWDGKGYPNGFVGEECPLEARLVGIVDVYDALTERRVYKEPWPIEKVKDFFADKSKNMFDPTLVNLLLTNYAQFESVRIADPADEMPEMAKGLGTR